MACDRLPTRIHSQANPFLFILKQSNEGTRQTMRIAWVHQYVRSGHAQLPAQLGPRREATIAFPAAMYSYIFSGENQISLDSLG